MDLFLEKEVKIVYKFLISFHALTFKCFTTCM